MGLEKTALKLRLYTLRRLVGAVTKKSRLMLRPLGGTARRLTMSTAPSKPLVAIIGTTGSGKSQVKPPGELG